MSLDTETLLDISADGASPELLLRWLVAHPMFASDLVKHYGDYWIPKAWAIKVRPVTGLALRGAGGFSISFKSRTLRVIT